MGRVAAQIVSHTYTHTHTHTHVQTQDLLFISAVARLRSRGTTDHMHMRRWTGEERIHAHLAGVGLKADL